MKRKVAIGLVVCAIMCLNVAPAVYGQTSTAGPSGSASATVPSFLEFSLSQVVQMRSGVDVDPWNDGSVQTTPNFTFGTLERQNDSSGDFLYMRGEYFYYVLMIAATSGRRYKITETGTQLSGTGGLLAKESVLLIPDYQWLDELGGSAQGAPPGTAHVGGVTSACNTNSLVYQSDTAGLGRIVRAIIAITGPALGETYPANYSLGYNGPTGQGTKQEYTFWKPITQDQVSGPYSGSVSFTLTLN